MQLVHGRCCGKFQIIQAGKSPLDIRQVGIYNFPLTTYARKLGYIKKRAGMNRRRMVADETHFCTIFRTRLRKNAKRNLVE